MKKILAIIGSEKSVDNSVTANLVTALSEKVKNQIEKVDAEILTLGDLDLKMCKGCRNCAKHGKCILTDNLDSLTEKIRNSDFIILGSPVHISHVSATYKNFLDRLHVPMHTFEFIGKPFVSVVSTNGSGEEETIKYIDHTALLLGMIKVGSLIKLNNEAFNHKKQERLVKEIVKVLNDRKNLKPSIKNSLYFWSMKKIIRENLEYFEYENKVWEQRGWYKSSFKRVFLAN